MDSVPFGKVRVHVRIYGKGAPLLLVHGLMTSSYSWRYAFEPLGAHFTCYAPDLVGSGRSSKPDRSYDPEACAVSIGEIVRALGIPGAGVIGNSLGGYLTMRLALREPSLMGRLVVVHAPGLATARMKGLRWVMRTPGALRLVESLAARDPERWVHRNVHYWDETLKSREEHREYAAPLRAPEGRRAFARILRDTLDSRAMRDFEMRLSSLGGKFPVPLLLLYAARDPMVPPSVGDRLHELLPDAAFVRIENGSHFMHVDATPAFAKEALAFLKG